MWTTIISLIFKNKKLIAYMIAILVIGVFIFNFFKGIEDLKVKNVQATQQIEQLQKDKKDIQDKYLAVEQQVQDIQALQQLANDQFIQQQQQQQRQIIVRERIVNAPVTKAKEDKPFANDPALLDAAIELRTYQQSDGSKPN